MIPIASRCLSNVKGRGGGGGVGELTQARATQATLACGTGTCFLRFQASGASFSDVLFVNYLFAPQVGLLGFRSEDKNTRDMLMFFFAKFSAYIVSLAWSACGIQYNCY